MKGWPGRVCAGLVPGSPIIEACIAVVADSLGIAVAVGIPGPLADVEGGLGRLGHMVVGLLVVVAGCTLEAVGDMAMLGRMLAVDPTAAFDCTVVLSVVAVADCMELHAAAVAAGANLLLQARHMMDKAIAAAVVAAFQAVGLDTATDRLLTVDLVAELYAEGPELDQLQVAALVA